MSSWMCWVREVWQRLVQGEMVVVPGWLDHPAAAGFIHTELAEPKGQAANWVLSLTDGSRLHVQEFADGALVVHRDPTDPARGPVEAIAHWLFESTSGRIALLLGAVYLAVRGRP